MEHFPLVPVVSFHVEGHLWAKYSWLSPAFTCSLPGERGLRFTPLHSRVNVASNAKLGYWLEMAPNSPSIQDPLPFSCTTSVCIGCILLQPSTLSESWFLSPGRGQLAHSSQDCSPDLPSPPRPVGHTEQTWLPGEVCESGEVLCAELIL